jgi:hypothetical protein
MKQGCFVLRVTVSASPLPPIHSEIFDGLPYLRYSNSLPTLWAGQPPPPSP